MKKLRLFIFLALISMLTLLALSGCKNEDSVESISFKDHDPSTAIEMVVGDFDYNAYTVVVVYKSGTTEEIALTEDMIAEMDLFKLYQVGEHDIAVNYGDSQYTFKVSVKIVAPVSGARLIPPNMLDIDGVNQPPLITAVKDINAKILPVTAGLTKFLPVPPNNNLTTIMAKALAKTGAYNGV